MEQKTIFRPRKPKPKKNRKANGYVLIDALVTVFIATTIFSAVIGGIAMAATVVSRSRERILTAIEERNAFEKETRIKTKVPSSVSASP